MSRFPIEPTEELRRKIDDLDLSMPLMKCMDTDEGYGWSPDHARLMERDYKRFLYLTVTRHEAIVPTKEIDKLWHAHVLDTRKYFADCEHLFGEYLHHFPYFGLRGEEDARNLSSAFAVTKDIWSNVFGDASSLSKATQGGIALCTGECSQNGGCSNCGSNGPPSSQPMPTIDLPPAIAVF